MNRLTRTARWTGAAYLALAVFGVAGFLVVRPRLRAPDDPAATLANLVDHAWLAHLGVGLELMIVVAQATAALGFYALFRRDRPAAALGVAVFGMANATAILASGAMLIAASAVADDAALAPARDAAATVALLLTTADAFWTVGAVFFGLWLIPMGYFVLSTNRMPRPLGWLLIAGGAAYLLSALLGATAPGLASAVGDVLSIPATIGEFWTIGYLLVRGIRSGATASGPDAGRGLTA